MYKHAFNTFLFSNFTLNTYYQYLIDEYRYCREIPGSILYQVASEIFFRERCVSDASCQ